LTENVITGNSIQINFTGVGESMLCFTALGPATTAIDLSTAENRDYQIELNNGGLRNNGILRINETEIKLLFPFPSGIEIVRPVTNRVPSNTYWGVIGYHASSSENLVNTFIQKLADKGAIFDRQTPGQYVYYEIDSNGEIVTNTENSGYYFSKAIIFQFNGNESELRDVITVDGGAYKNELSINMTTFRGEQINNWSN
jgi:hypothetical protein